MKFKQIGKTEDNKKVINNVFKMYNSYGLPLNTLFEVLDMNNYIPCWITFNEDALKAGWTQKTIIARLEDAILDVYGKQFYDQWRVRFYKVLKNE